MPTDSQFLDGTSDIQRLAILRSAEAQGTYISPLTDACFKDATEDVQRLEILRAIEGISGGGAGGTAYYGQVSRITSGTINIATAGTYQSTGLTATLDAENVGVSLGTTDLFAVKNTSGFAQLLKIYGSADIDAGNNTVLGIKLALNGTPIDTTECNASTGQGTTFAKLVTNWMIELQPNDEVALFVTNKTTAGNVTLLRGRLVASTVGKQGPIGPQGPTGPAVDTSNFVQKSGDTMTGKLNLPASTTASAPINIGSGAGPTSPVSGDLWIDGTTLTARVGGTTRPLAFTNGVNSFTRGQVVNVTENTIPALRVTQTGTGEALRVEDDTSPDATAFVVSNTGKVGVGVTPDATVCLSIDATGLKFNDGTIQTTAADTGSFVQKSGDTMTGKLIAAADLAASKLNIGNAIGTPGPTSVADGDLWISNQNKFAWRTNGNTITAAGLSQANTFNQPQTIVSTSNAAPVATISNTGTREAAVFNAQGTSPAVRITQTGTGEALRVEDDTTPDATAFVISNLGRVGIGVTPDATVSLSLDSTGVKFDDGTIQTTAATGSTVTPTDVQVFTSSGTWTKPANAKSVSIQLLGAGGGGGGGFKNVTGANRLGGGGGGGGGYLNTTVPASLLSPSAIDITIGAGGAGGAGSTTNGVLGVAGVQGGSTIFGTGVSGAITYIALGGIGGAAGSSTSGIGGAGSLNANNGGQGGSGNGGPGIPASVTSSHVMGGAGGGGGGGLNAASAIGLGNIGGRSNVLNLNGGAVNGGNGIDNVNAVNGLFAVGSGGGAGNASLTNGVNGGNGGFPASGAGGGGAAESGNGGNGGTGGAGMAIITTYF